MIIRIIRKLTKIPFLFLVLIITYVFGVFIKNPKQKERDISWKTGREMIFQKGQSYWMKRLEQMGLVKPGIKVLEVGSGNGQWLFCFAQFAEKVVGTEPNDQIREFSVKKAKEFRVEDKVQICNFAAENIPVKYENFDLVFCVAVFMFTKQNQALEQFRRILKEGGKLVITVNGIGYFIMYILDGMRYFSFEKTHYGLLGLIYTFIKWLTGKQLGTCAVSHTEMNNMFNKHGFKLLDSRLWLGMDLYPKEHLGFVTNYLFLAEKHSVTE